MNELSLFTGAGGGLLGTHLLGWKPVGYVEWNEYCQRVIAARIEDGLLSKAPIFGDVRGIETVDFYASLSYRESKILEDDMVAHRKTYLDEAAKLYSAGFSIAETAHHYGVTRQSMWKSLVRRGVEMRDKSSFGEENHFYRGGPRAIDRVHNLVENAIQRGILINPKHCESCDVGGVFADGRSAIQAHHDDYNKPLEVRWLCQKCHHAWHIENRAIEMLEEDSEVSRGVDVITAGFP